MNNLSKEDRIRELASHMAGFNQATYRQPLVRLDDLPESERRQWLLRAEGIIDERPKVYEDAT